MQKDELIRRLADVQNQIDSIFNFNEHEIWGTSKGKSHRLNIDKDSVALAVEHCKKDLLKKRDNLIIELENITL